MSRSTPTRAKAARPRATAKTTAKAKTTTKATATRSTPRISVRGPAPKRSRRRSTRTDPLVVMYASVAFLVVLGVAMVFSASTVFARNADKSPYTYLQRQLLFVAVGLVVALIASRLTPTFVRRMVPFVGLFAVVSLVVVLLPTPITRSVNGSSRWIGSSALGFQPAEVAKVAVVLWVAHLMAVRAREMADWRRTVVPVGTVTLGCAGLLNFQPDLGSALLIVTVAGVLLVVAGARLDSMSLLAVPVLAVAAYLATSGYHARRWGYLDATSDISGENFQLFGSLSSLASGGWFGVGPGASKNKWGWIPEAHTDAIFAVIGEELGVIGCVAVIFGFVAFIGSGVLLAKRTRDRFSMLVIVGLTAQIGLQAFINIGVTTGLLPSKGFTLPFVSYGGSSMVVTLGSVGLISAMARNRA